ncbi:tetratricopeptide repeat protein [Archangium primigenium]|uniref:tetratricopeptide repeat protein n=1 Tax=[Archangium] primigenium TaxID=2792470 RepID=UPI00195B2E85|nr:tetratricopeptide repeat protein [Archangium primigenium]MBM7117940.1 tetratricopeptide repeat protein [Archangium primigenium]
MRTSVLFASILTLCLAACESGSLRRSQVPLAPPEHLLAPEAEGTPAVSSPPAEAVLPESPPDRFSLAEDLAPAEPSDELSLPHEAHLAPVDHLGRARALRAEGDLSGALTEVRRAVHDAGDDLDARETALDHLIPLARLMGKKLLAADAYTELAHLFPEGPEPLVQKARVLLEVGDVEGSLRAAEAALLLDPEYPEVYQVLGRGHLAAGELGEAIVRFQQAVHLDPYHGYALNNLGLAWLLTGRDAEAAEALAQAAYLLPYEGFVHNNLGLAYERLGRYEEAAMAFDTATRLTPGSARARLNKARLERQPQASAPLQARRSAHTADSAAR